MPAKILLAVFVKEPAMGPDCETVAATGTATDRVSFKALYSQGRAIAKNLDGRLAIGRV